MTRLTVLREKYPAAWPEHVLAEFAGACRRGERTFAEARELEAALTAGLRALDVQPQLVAALELIQEMAAEDLRTGRFVSGTALFQIEAEARAALAATEPTP